MTVNKKEKPKHLGRGLEALLGSLTTESDEGVNQTPITVSVRNYVQEKDLGETLKELPLNLISPNLHQPRTQWDQKQLEQLAESIKSNGIIEPIIVRPAGDRYQIIAGERRFRASTMAGREKIPAVIRLATDRQMLELALIENIHRTDLNSLERAKAYKNYIETFSLTQEQAAEKLSENRSVIANYIRLLDLPSEIKQMLTDRTLSMGHARAILALPNDDLRNKIAKMAMTGRLSVRNVEALVKKTLSKTEKSDKKPKNKPANIYDLENSLTNKMGTKVTINTQKGGQRGKISIEFYSLDDFDRITELLGVEYANEL
ncbi:MAG: ParB/RepB/Spo0J family partition protein [Planctomycetes bacterium]|nr:ParB/RepB/Spo0J family partition protein [Planctomycetota bacterium]MBL7106131.1 ParB/RepB/Spo0J family partition protein [Phycisphaerae bacterium]